MVGILAAAAYVPRYRLPSRIVAESWRRRARDEARAVANHDEDSFTMAAAAADWCLRASARTEVDGVFYASTSAPYREKMIAPMVAAVADQPLGLATADFSSSLRAGLGALAAASDAISSGRLGSVLVAAADQRVPRPGAELDYVVGDGAAAVLVGPAEEALAVLDLYVTRSDDFLHVWRRERDRFLASADPRFARQEGYLKSVVPAVREALESAGISLGEVEQVVLDGPDGGSIGAAATALGLRPEQVVDPLLGSVGHTGSAHTLLLLAAALERARPGERILLTAYGDGIDVALLTATERVAGWTPFRTVPEQVADAWELDSYQRYLSFRELVEGQEPLERPFSSISLLRRTARQDVRFYGARCLECGRVQYPIPRICRGCHVADRLEEVKLARRGIVFTLSKEHYFPTADPPLVVAIVDLEGGGRVVVQGTDVGDRAVEVGTPVELVYRKYHEGQGFHNYYWKCRPEPERSA